MSQVLFTAFFSAATLFINCVALIGSGDLSSGCIESGRQFRIGITWTSIKECARYTCVGNSEIHGVTCPVYQLGSGCVMTEEDPSKTFPDCCPRPYCPPKDGCWVNGKKYEIGNNLTLPGQCARFTCTANDTVVGNLCEYAPTVHLNSSCIIKEMDLSKPFPQCCARRLCMVDYF